MNITDVKIRKLFPDGKLKAIVSVTFDDNFVIHDIKVIEGQNGQFIAMPNRKTSRGEFKDICHPIKKETREYLEGTILNAYQNWVDENGEDALDNQGPDNYSFEEEITETEN